ncbi:hypothetical protein Cni_G26302 [Canna indica]|uniref:Uncharacterized protein n=1 Tax=Canna indica TaxID=4628 RepID=A0AAQ3KZ72_9LILI|nr:hypothetical protein Cni_G26302 [Canna indica]
MAGSSLFIRILPSNPTSREVYILFVIVQGQIATHILQQQAIDLNQWPDASSQMQKA